MKIKWISIGSKFKIESKGMLFNWNVWQVEMEMQNSDLKSIKHDDYFVKGQKERQRD